jgi:hypothetical protein
MIPIRGIDQASDACKNTTTTWLSMVPAVYSEYDTKVCRRSNQPKSRASRAFEVISTSRFFWMNLQ